MSRTKIIIIVALVIVLVIILLYIFRDKVFAATPKVTIAPNPNAVVPSSVFPLKVGSYNIPEVEILQTYLEAHGGTSCNGSPLIVDGDYGPNTQCAVTQILGASQVSESLFKSLGL